MIEHRHHLIENGTMLSCDVSGCPTHGKPFLVGGGENVDTFDGKDDPLIRLAEAIAQGVEANSKVKELEEKVKKLEKENEDLWKTLKGCCPGFFGEE